MCQKVVAVFDSRFLFLLLPGVVLVSDLPEVRKIVETHDLGWVADLTTPKKIAEAIDVALFDERVLKKRRENAARAFETLCWEEEEKKLIEVYEGL